MKIENEKNAAVAAAEIKKEINAVVYGVKLGLQQYDKKLLENIKAVLKFNNVEAGSGNVSYILIDMIKKGLLINIAADDMAKLVKEILKQCFDKDVKITANSIADYRKKYKAGFNDVDVKLCGGGVKNKVKINIYNMFK